MSPQIEMTSLSVSSSSSVVAQELIPGDLCVFDFENSIKSTKVDFTQNIDVWFQEPYSGQTVIVKNGDIALYVKVYKDESSSRWEINDGPCKVFCLPRLNRLFMVNEEELSCIAPKIVSPKRRT